MTTLLALLVGVLCTAGVFLILRGNLFRLVLGMVVLSNAINLLIMSASRSASRAPPLVPPDAAGPTHAVADPLPQALVLTAIVIGFALVAFTLLLVRRAFDEFETTDARTLAAMSTIDDAPVSPGGERA